MPRAKTIPDDLYPYCRKLRGLGLTDAEIARRLRIEKGINATREAVVWAIGRSGRNQKTQSGRTNIRISLEDRTIVQDIAAGLGLTVTSGVESPGKPSGSLTQLLRAIANGDVVCITKSEYQGLFDTIRDLSDPDSELRAVADRAHEPAVIDA
jgi:hypothetical protein